MKDAWKIGMKEIERDEQTASPVERPGYIWRQTMKYENLIGVCLKWSIYLVGCSMIYYIIKFQIAINSVVDAVNNLKT